MTIKEYTLENWRELLEKDWEYLHQDNGSGNVERIIDQLFQCVINELEAVIKTLS